jgi:hypothetical protein
MTYAQYNRTINTHLFLVLFSFLVLLLFFLLLLLLLALFHVHALLAELTVPLHLLLLVLSHEHQIVLHINDVLSVVGAASKGLIVGAVVGGT